MKKRVQAPKDNFEKLEHLESNRVPTEFRIANDYWLRTVEPFIRGRKLRQPELAIAEHAYSYLEQADREAADWNATEQGRLCPVQNIAWSTPEYRRPEPLCRDSLKPELLASLAASMMTTRKDLSVNIRRAHDLLIAAEQYIESLPVTPPQGRAAAAAINSGFMTVSFAQILESNQRNSGSLRLLPPDQEKRKGKKEEEITGAQTMDALRVAFRKFASEQRFDCAEYAKRGEIPLWLLCKLRWQRYRKSALRRLHPDS